MKKNKDKFYIGVFEYSFGDIEIEVVKAENIKQAKKDLHSLSGWDQDKYSLHILTQEILFHALCCQIKETENIEKHSIKVATTKGDIEFNKIDLWTAGLISFKLLDHLKA